MAKISGFLVILMFLACASIAVVFYYNSKAIQASKPIQINNSNCSNLSLVDTSYCLRDWVLGFYKYNNTRVSNNLSFAELQENGGNCRDYTLLYQNILEGYGFLTKKISIYPENEGDGHTFLIAWDKNLEAYCRMDMLYVNCIKFGKE